MVEVGSGGAAMEEEEDRRKVPAWRSCLREPHTKGGGWGKAFRRRRRRRKG